MNRTGLIYAESLWFFGFFTVFIKGFLTVPELLEVVF